MIVSSYNNYGQGLTDGTKYYLDCLDRIYRVKRELDWVQSRDSSPGYGKFARQQLNEVIFSDTINDKPIFMEELKKK